MAKVGVGDLDITKRGQRWAVGLLMLAIGAAIGYALPQSTASPKSVVGTVISVGKDAGGGGVPFVFKPDGSTKTVSYMYENPTPWLPQPSGTWKSNGQPSCLVPGSTKPVRATLGVVTVSSVSSAPGGPLVVWIECYG
jgi:hypothetical protein